MKGLISVQKLTIGKLKRGDRFKFSDRNTEDVYKCIAGMRGRMEMLFENSKGETLCIPKCGKDEVVTIVTD